MAVCLPSHPFIGTSMAADETRPGGRREEEAEERQRGSRTASEAVQVQGLGLVRVLGGHLEAQGVSGIEAPQDRTTTVEATVVRRPSMAEKGEGWCFRGAGLTPWCLTVSRRPPAAWTTGTVPYFMA